jgi:hypothetical protein
MHTKINVGEKEGNRYEDRKTGSICITGSEGEILPNGGLCYYRYVTFWFSYRGLGTPIL